MKQLLLVILGACLVIAGMYSCFSNGNDLSKWTETSDLGREINSPYNEEFPMLSADGLSLYFASDRPGSLGDSTATGFEALDIYVSRRIETGAWVLYFQGAKALRELYSRQDA